MAFIYSSIIWALNSGDVNKNIHAIKSKINQINSELVQKQQQQQNIDKALVYSTSAIDQSSMLLQQLKKKRDLNLQQLNDIQNSLNMVNQSIISTKQLLQAEINTIYQQIQTLELKQQSILSGNDTMSAERQKIYLIAILNTKQSTLNTLQNKITTLQVINSNLQQEVNKIDQQLDMTTKKQQQLQYNKQHQIQSSQQLVTQINLDKNKLNSLKEQQTRLNNLMNQIIAAEIKAKAQKAEQNKHRIQLAKSRVTSDKTSSDEVTDTKAGYNDASPFFSRKTVKPINAGVQLGFDDKRDNVPNKGILFNLTENIEVHAISNGKVMYTGNLPSFGKVIIIDHGNDYMSIYSGIVPQVKVGDTVNTGQTIANTGSKDNQPLGGMYFELRHLGKPVNPNALI